MEWLTSEFWQLVAVGFAAQLIDGALGMAYGLTASAFLATLGQIGRASCRERVSSPV